MTDAEKVVRARTTIENIIANMERFEGISWLERQVFFLMRLRYKFEMIQTTLHELSDVLRS